MLLIIAHETSRVGPTCTSMECTRLCTVGSQVWREWRTSAVVQVKPTPRIENSSSRAQEARSAKEVGQSDSVVAVSVTGTGAGPERENMSVRRVV